MPQQICYFPTTVVLLDDNRNFVDSIVGAFANDPEFVLKGDTNCGKIKEATNRSLSLIDFLPTYKTDIEEFQHAGVNICIDDIFNLASQKRQC